MKVIIGKYPKDPNKGQKLSIKIDDHDLWDLSWTLTKVILPSLKKFRESKRHGVPCNTPIWEYMAEDHYAQGSFDFYKESSPTHEDANDDWNKILDKMIWSFSELDDPKEEDSYWDVKPEIDWDDFKTPCEDNPDYYEMKWKVEGKLNEQKRTEYYEKLQEGLDLFAKYYRNLWD